MEGEKLKFSIERTTPSWHRGITGVWMRNVLRLPLLLVVPALFLTGCSRLSEQTKLYVSDADERLVLDRPAPVSSEHYQFFPEHHQRIVCIEPSPDIARALSLAATAKAGTPTVTGEVDVSYQQMIAQLAGRTAAVVALRDGLFRACEAYANGIIGKELYVLLVSQYGDTMTTIMLGEDAQTTAQAAASASKSNTASTDALKPPSPIPVQIVVPYAADPSKPITLNLPITVTAVQPPSQSTIPPSGTANPGTVGGTGAPKADGTGNSTDPISQIYSTYTANAGGRFLNSVFASCAAYDNNGERKSTYLTQLCSSIEDAGKLGDFVTKVLPKGSSTNPGNAAPTATPTIFKVPFASGDSTVTSIAAKQQVASAYDAFVKSNKTVNITVVGEASKSGDAQKNMALSLQRAEAVRSVLVNSYFVDASRVFVAGVGQDNADNAPLVTINLQ
jgi:outer membrane protein OmpA-like peptidoglycan-associated protein